MTGLVKQLTATNVGSFGMNRTLTTSTWRKRLCPSNEKKSLFVRNVSFFLREITPSVPDPSSPQLTSSPPASTHSKEQMREFMVILSYKE